MLCCIIILPQYPYENTLFNANILSEMKNLIFIDSGSKPDTVVDTSVVKIIPLPHL